MKRFFYLFASILVLSACKTPYPHLDNGIYADMETNKGNILLSLAYDKTPATVANFVALSEGNHPTVAPEFEGKPYYDGILFHRVIQDFMIQGGDPTGTGSGGPGYRFDDEITDLKHDGPGILSMANAGPGTNGSQFFITHKETPWLDGKHTVFGFVVEGQSVVDTIQQKDTIRAIKIIRKGKEAKRFDAPKVFQEFLDQKEQREKEAAEKAAAIKSNNTTRFEQAKANATSTASGLSYTITQKGNGPAVTSTNKALAHYAVYFTDGTLLDTSMSEVAQQNDMLNEAKLAAGKYVPLLADVSPEAELIAGFKEGVALLRQGDKATVFLPSGLAYGEKGRSGIPPNSDLIFELEIVEVIE
ncbi:MAG: peptidylprolyl isomerase [Flavobacteriaceae bacterium]